MQMGNTVSCIDDWYQQQRKVQRGEHQCYEKKLKIMRHIKEVNPCVNELHTEPENTVQVNCISLTFPDDEHTVALTKDEVEYAQQAY